MRRKIETTKKTISRAISFVLALMVLVSSLPYVPLVTNALTPTNPKKDSQTGFNDVTEFQKAKWKIITDTVFGVSSYNTTPPASNATFNVVENNGYFNWYDCSKIEGVTTGWDGTETTVETTTETISYAGDDVDAGDGLGEKIDNQYTGKYTQAAFDITYTVYNVSNAAELRYAMNEAETNRKTQNTKINITADIDLNGKENIVWKPNYYSSMNKNWIYIEGNGHTIYNMRCHNNQKDGSNYGNGGFAGYVSDGSFIMKNLNFSNCMSFSNGIQCTSVVIGSVRSQAYFENVNIRDSFIYSNVALTGTLIGRTETGVGNIFVRNCSSQRCYVYGTSHSGGLTGCQHNIGGRNNSNDAYKVKYNAAFPESPEAWLKKGSNVYPEVIEDTYSVDCTVFSTADDSGAFVSCGGKMIIRNCFTNNIMYGNTKTGAFLGRIVTKDSGVKPLYDDNGNRTVNIYFENCYASGSIEGASQIGGFVALDDCSDNYAYGVAVYKNCYTTAMVGMDYAGTQLGGFIGYENTYQSQKATIKVGGTEDNPIYNTNSGSVYINCYAAGEVGNILTDTSTTPIKDTNGNYKYLGGFLGFTNNTNGNFINCYYDMQTTAMRERASGKSDQFYVSDFSAIDSAVNATSALTETQRYNLIKLRADYVYHMESKVDENYNTNIDLTTIDNALDFITDTQKEKLTALKNQIKALDSNIDVSAINDALGIVNYTGSQKKDKLQTAKTELGYIISNSPDVSITSKINGLPVCNSTNAKNSAISDTNMTALKTLEEKIKDLITYKLLPSDLDYSAISDVYGRITDEEKTNLQAFETILKDSILVNYRDKLNTALKAILKEKDSTTYTDEVLADISQETLDEESGFNDMLTALNQVANAEENAIITTDQNDKLVQLRLVLINAGLFGNSYFTVNNVYQGDAHSSIAVVTNLVAQKNKNILNSLKNTITANYPKLDITVVNSILNNAANTGMLTDEQKVGLIALKSSLNTAVSQRAVPDYLNYKYGEETGQNKYNDILNIIDDLLDPISDEEKAALLALKEQLASYSEIDTSIIDEVTGNDSTLPLTEKEKQALQILKDQSLPYASQIPGVTGVYTQSSKKKNVEGLAGSVDGGITVDMGDDNAWQNDTKEDMYPALKVFYDDEKIHQNFGTMNISGQKMTTETITDESGSETSQKVYSSLYDTDTETRIKERLAEKEKIVKSYAKASVSTVLLDHWDITMNMNTGTIGEETKWALGLSQNRLEKTTYTSNRWQYDDDNTYWSKKYENLTAGEYEFKIQQGESWAYSFGNNKFGGSDNNCKLKVPIDCDVYVNFDYTGKVSELGEDTIFRIWAEYRNKDGSLISSEILGEKVGTIAKEFTLAGSFGPNGTDAFWNPENRDYDMDYIGNSKYQFSKEFETGTYYFKVVQNHSWGVSYGQGGLSQNANNMSFTITQDCVVFFEFNEETKLTTVTASIPEALTAQTDLEIVDFEGYSAIFKVSCFTGQEWDNTDTSKQLLAAQLGQLDYDSSSGTYTKTFQVDRYPKNEEGTYDKSVDYFEQKSFAYKVIKDAKNEGKNHYFTIIPDDSVEKIELTVSYNPITNETSISTNTAGVEFSEKAEVTFYGIMGTKALTGYNWDQDGHDTAAPMSSTDNKIWTQTYQNVPAGEHSFKVVANGTFSTGIDFGASDGGNYTINTTQTADITITFDSEKERISVTSNPTDAIIKEQYVVCGNSYLTGVNKVTDSKQNIMVYNEDNGLYEKTYNNLAATLDGTKLKNYVFKVVKFGQNNTDNYIQFVINNPDDEDGSMKYKLVIQYDANNAVTNYYLYNSNDEIVNEFMQAPEVTSYFVAGDKDLTGYSWLEDTSEAAKKALEMKAKDGTDGSVYTATFENVAVSPISRYLSFKIVADGTWDSGIDYGDDKKGGNYIITLTAPSSTVTSCSVTIDFNTATKKISVTTSPDCMAQIDESDFEWYLCGDERIVSEDAYKAPNTIYDTVRDITVAFDFTSDKNLTWEKDFSSTSRNEENGFFEYLGGYLKDGEGNYVLDSNGNKQGKGFTIDYKVEGKEITGTFAEPVITIKGIEVCEDSETYTKYSCTEFMPGKQWVTVKDSVEGTNIVGTRNIRIIPTAYLEAGNDATVKVLQADSDQKNENVKNIVSYSQNSIDGITFTGFDENTLFKNYNFAMTSGYAITDINGIGYYGIYSQQGSQYGIQSYAANKKRANSLKYPTNNTYFVMTSAFAQTAKYTDENSETNNLVIDELVDQILVGSSYSPENASDRDKAKTIVKVYKLNAETNMEEKVFMDSTEGSTSSYHDNYLKWTGQKAFSKDDIGEYRVTYYWSLADGRYLEDSKSVTITSNVSDIEKKVNEVDECYIEKGDSKEITYTVTYANRSQGDFIIYDVLPFSNDIRLGENPLSSTLGKSFKIKSYSVVSDDDTKISASELKSYYTTSADVQDKDNLSSVSAAKSVDLTDTTKWNEISESFSEIPDVTAIAVKGTQTTDGECTITITYTLQVDASVGDYYVNNAFFTFDNTLAKELYGDNVSINGYSNYVKTAVVSANISGYVWYDININGTFDSNETPIQNVAVKLVDVDNNIIASTVTDENGYYEFDVNTNGSEKNYKVVFSNGDGKINIGGTECDFNDLIISRTRAKRYVTDIKSSVNIAKEDTSSTETNRQYYIDETVPTSDEIYLKNYNYIDNFKVINYNLPMNYQNLGLRTQVEEKECSLTVKKIESGTNNTLAGVKFKLEYMPGTSTASEEGDSTSSEYQPLYVKQVSDASGNITYEFTTETTGEGVITADGIPTDQNGLIKFTGLPSDALYRLTEVNTLDGYNLLPMALEFALPYYIEGGNTSPDGYIVGEDENPYEGKYYYNVTYTVTNSKIPSMPLTGVENNIVPIIIAAVMLTVGIAVFFVFKVVKWRKKSQNTTTK
ncbi:MAG: SdrD B-like domain-containing protein [Acutalibacteraceae bacterium]